MNNSKKSQPFSGRRKYFRPLNATRPYQLTMTSFQFYLGGLLLLIILSIVINTLFKKYQILKEYELKGIRFDNNSIFTNVKPGSFMLRLPIVILYRPKIKSLKRLVVIHNIFTFLFYVLFAFIIYCDYKNYF